MRTILFVCTGNVCRSPMAEGLFRHALANRNDFRVLSAGVGAIDGHPPSAHAVHALSEVGIDISQNRSRRLTPELVRDADYILCMTRGHAETINLIFPAASEKTMVLRELDDRFDEHQKDISDPIGSPYEIYVNCRDDILDGINALLKFIDNTNSTTPIKDIKRSVNIALGSDHAGFSLKETIKKILEERGHEYQDFGTHSQESTDYPDYAKAVAQSVADQSHDLGILVCATGIGMSIAANKVGGIRAALTHDPESTALARKHNDANVLCLGGRFMDPETAGKLVEVFLDTSFEGGRHERRVYKVSNSEGTGLPHVQRTDPQIATAIQHEVDRQQNNIELIASENFTSRAVMEAQGSVLTNKYAEGYPGKRWYGGCEHVDDAETIAIQRAKLLFKAEHANVQPHSGSGANMAVYFAMLKPGDKILTMDLSHGGHLTHGNKANFSGRFYEVIHYGVRKEDELIDYDQLEAMAKEHKPQMITVGASAYPRIIDFERMGQISRSVGALLLADIAHIAGLVAAGLHPSPIGHADFVTTTTHKTLRGPRGGLVLCGAEHAKAIDSQTFPGIQGGPLMHVIAAKAVCFQEALQPDFKAYQLQVIKNANALAEGLIRNGFRIVSGGTDNHLMLVDVGIRDITGKECQAALDAAGITVNKNTIPFETRSPFQASGIRLGTPAVTTRDMNEPEMDQIADMVSEMILNIKNLDAAQKVRQRVLDLTARFPLPY